MIANSSNFSLLLPVHLVLFLTLIMSKYTHELSCPPFPWPPLVLCSYNVIDWSNHVHLTQSGLMSAFHGTLDLSMTVSDIL